MEIFLGLALTISVTSNVVTVYLFLRELRDYKDRFMARDYREFLESKANEVAMKEILKEKPEKKEEEKGVRLKQIAKSF